MRFSWDPEKARINLRKHGIRFETVTRIFGDPLAEWREDDPIDGEERWQRIGFIDEQHLVVVAYTIWSNDDGSETVRIISARHAEAWERRRHERG